MGLTKTYNEGVYIVCVNENLTAVTSPELEAELKDMPEDIEELVIDLSGIDYMSSAGLRVMLSLQQRMNEKGAKLTVRGVRGMVRDIFEETGFVNLFHIEDQ